MKMILKYGSIGILVIEILFELI